MYNRLIFRPEAFPRELLLEQSPGPWESETEYGELDEEFRGGRAPRFRPGFSGQRRIPGRPGVARRKPRPPWPPRRPWPRRGPWPSGPWGVGQEPAGIDSGADGAGSEHVRWIQDCLNRAMAAQLPVDGMMTPATRSVIRSFQQRHGMTPSGIMGPDTEEALKRACSGSAGPAATDGQPQANGDASVAGDQEIQSDSVGIIDLTASADKSVRKGTRDPKTVYALVLHQMACCFKPKEPLKRFLSLGAHFAILADGRILQLHPVSALVWASNGFSNRSVAVEFAGNFPNIKGRWWKGDTYGTNHPTAAQFAAGRRLIRHLMRTIGLTHVLAHRQSSGTRENDPGPDIWYQVGQWAVDSLRLKDGGPGFKIGTGNAIPAEWRTWGHRAVAPETSTALEAAQSETEIAHDVWEGEALEAGSLDWDSGSIREIEVPPAIKGAIAQLPAAQRPRYRSAGRLADAVNTVKGPGLYLLVFSAGGQRKAYSGKADDLKRRLMQHRLCAQMLGVSADDHQVFIARVPPANLRSTEKAVNASVMDTNPKALTNQRRELEAALLGESWA